MSKNEQISEKPIPFSAPMVRAILDGRKSMTRRVVKGNFAPDEFIRKESGAGYGWHWPNWKGKENLWTMTGAVGVARDAGFDVQMNCPYGKPGDRLWIKTGYTTRYDPERNETHWKTEGGWITTHGRVMSLTGRPKRDGGHPGRFMPKWLSQEFRLPRLEITDVRVERLREITEEDAIAEGAQCAGFPASLSNRGAFINLWEKLNGPRDFGWLQNPWVWVISFKRSEV